MRRTMNQFQDRGPTLIVAVSERGAQPSANELRLIGRDPKEWASVRERPQLGEGRPRVAKRDFTLVRNARVSDDEIPLIGRIGCSIALAFALTMGVSILSEAAAKAMAAVERRPVVALFE